MIDTNKQLLISESHSDSNLYTPYREKSDQHDTYASHSSRRTPGIHFLQAVLIRDNLSQVINSVGWILLLPTPPLSPAKWSVEPTSVSLPTQSMKQ
jgi:hypothetical protein